MLKEIELSSKIFSSTKTLRIILTYVILSAVWIFISSGYVGKLMELKALQFWWQLCKDWSWIIISSGFLYIVINRSIFLIDKAKAEAENANRLKTEFLAQMTHEIRTPLYISQNFMTKIKWELEDKMTPELAADFEIIENSDRRLLRTIELILRMSEMQLGTYKPMFANADLKKDIIERIEHDFALPAKNKGLELNFYYKTDEARINCDIFSISEVLKNLLDNGIKFTEKGRVELTLEKNFKDEFCISVVDTGKGMSKEFLSELFEPFHQEDRGIDRRYEGNGLGLALAKKYCELNNASIDVESEPGKGSKFTVTFHIKK
jgi:signal transduction histidine kinase